jgi:hypothetical protein
MTRARSIPFSELRRFLNGLGFTAKRAEAAWVFRHQTEGLIVLRLYGEDEAVDAADLRSTRKFLDLRGLLDGQSFDAFVQQANAPA